ncbi:N-methyl-L-tryptophan oxidase [Fructilactobacillus myrtifloralis]|uniref:N-methyl-L-tryptophan oxidase n=1 Tax=Fructilactobacillus myrtifloralis TaxID=2940301 RepID=A0ABY5BPP1_9LACO|nr:N-methyl-L-tryptophan oxidase [Fructilactobacillus myrtifloralis]USS84921.1 N-methyl-L-tryptophan oxidase [Fructilactobacillus myrtifloralis]
MTTTYDLAIVGTGSVGAAAGYYASQAGLNVLELDAHVPPHDAGSHHGQTRLIRHAYGEGDQYVPLVLESQRLWNELAINSGQPIFHQTGILTVAQPTTPFFTTLVHSAHEFQLPLETLTAPALQARYPNWHFSDQYQALFEPTGGYLESETAISAYLQLARHAGVRQEFNQPVTGFQRLANGTVEIRTTQGTYQARQVAITAGTWVKELLPDLPVQPVRKVFSWFHTTDQRLTEAAGFPGFTVELATGNTYYGFPGTDGTIKIGKHNGGQPIRNPHERTPFGTYEADDHEIDELLATHLTGTAGLDHGGACSYDLTPDENFIIDYLPGTDNIQLVTGLSGHGFKFASVLGQIVADRAAHQPEPFDLTPFRLQRFHH